MEKLIDSKKIRLYCSMKQRWVKAQNSELSEAQEKFLDSWVDKNCCRVWFFDLAFKSLIHAWIADSLLL